MPKIIQIPRPLSARDGVLLKRSQLRQACRAQTLLDDAQQHTRRLIKAADAQTDSIRQQAFAHGYQQGILAAANDLVAYLDKVDQLKQLLHTQLEQQAHAMLSAALDTPELILVLLDEWLQQYQIETATMPLQLTLPRTVKALHSTVMTHLADSWSERVHINYHDDPRFILRCGLQMAEFDPEHFIQQAQSELLHRVHDFSQQTRQLSQETLQQLRQTFERCFVSCDENNTEKEETVN